MADPGLLAAIEGGEAALMAGDVVSLEEFCRYWRSTQRKDR